MKKAVLILLLLIYGSATMGATVYVHYCMNEIAGWSLSPDGNEKCGKCGMEEKDQDKENCCKDEHKHFQLKVDHQKGSIAQFTDLTFIPALAIPVIVYRLSPCLKINEKYPVSHAPPDIVKKRLHVLHCAFLI